MFTKCLTFPQQLQHDNKNNQQQQQWQQQQQQHTGNIGERGGNTKRNQNRNGCWLDSKQSQAKQKNRLQPFLPC